MLVHDVVSKLMLTNETTVEFYQKILFLFCSSLCTDLAYIKLDIVYYEYS